MSGRSHELSNSLYHLWYLTHGYLPTQSFNKKQDYSPPSKHSWQLSYKRLDQLWYSLMALGHYVKQGFKQKMFDPTIDNGLKLAFIDAT